MIILSTCFSLIVFLLTKGSIVQFWQEIVTQKQICQMRLFLDIAHSTACILTCFKNQFSDGHITLQ